MKSKVTEKSRLNKKLGWYDGNARLEKGAIYKTVSKLVKGEYVPIQKLLIKDSIEYDEGYYLGLDSKQGDRNPFGNYK